MRSVIIMIATMVGCSSGEPLGAPEVQPPVKDTTAPGLLAGISAQLTDGAQQKDTPPTPIEVFQGRFLGPGPTDYLDRLAKIDERMAELNTRSEESARTCTGNAATDWVHAGTLPTGETFGLKIQCLEELTADTSYLAFGIDGDYFYLSEQQKANGNAPTIGVYAKTKMDSSATEFWFIGGSGVSTDNGDNYVYMHLTADKTAGTNEIAVAGVGSGFGVGCGVQIRSDANYVYGKGIWASFGDPVATESVTDGTEEVASDASQNPTEDCSGSQNAEIEFCIQASDLAEADLSACADLSAFTLEKLTYANVVAKGAEDTDAIITTWVNVGTDFNETSSGSN